MPTVTKPGTYRLEVHDNEIDTDLQKDVLNFLLDSEYCVNFYDRPYSLYKPRSDTYITPRDFPAQPKLPMAWDEESLAERAPIVYKLWLAINNQLGNTLAIDGVPESMNYMLGISPVQGITKSDGSPGRPNSGWRVYGNGNEREPGARTKAIHRDNPFIDDDTCVNIVYFANDEWHPSWYGETLFHGNNNTTGDVTGRFHPDQPRSQPIGDIENVVEVRPGRFMVFDARYLHQYKPVYEHLNVPLLGIVFRCRLK